MAEPLPNPSDPGDSSVEPHPVQLILRFLRAAYYRKGIIIVALAASCLTGGLYYSTAPRIYESKSSLLVLQMGEVGNFSIEMSGTRTARDLMVTYQNMLSSEVVMEAALETLPPEHRDDLEGAPRDKWGEILQQNLDVSVVRNGNILNMVYRSKDPVAATAVVNSILTAYLDFMDRLHRNTSTELLDILNNEKVKLEQQMRIKQDQLIAVRRDTKELGIRDGD